MAEQMTKRLAAIGGDYASFLRQYPQINLRLLGLDEGSFPAPCERRVIIEHNLGMGGYPGMLYTPELEPVREKCVLDSDSGHWSQVNDGEVAVRLHRDAGLDLEACPFESFESTPAYGFAVSTLVGAVFWTDIERELARE